MWKSAIWTGTGIIAGAIRFLIQFIIIVLVLHVVSQIGAEAVYDPVAVPPVAHVGDALPFRMQGFQKPSCSSPSARVLVYDDGEVRPLTDVAYPDMARLQSAINRVPGDKTDARHFDLHTALPMPKSYIHPGRAFFLQEVDETPCGWMRGVVPVTPHMLVSNWVTILPPRGTP